MNWADRIIVADIGGTHARFAVAEHDKDGGIRLGEPAIFKTGSFESFSELWPAVRERLGNRPDGLAVAAAGPLRGGAIKLTNAAWLIERAELESLAANGRALLLNDLEAVGHAAGSLPPDWFDHILGPQRQPSRDGVTAVAGIGTGFGLAVVDRQGSDYRVRGTEGGHADFPAATDFERQLAAQILRTRERVSYEAVLSGPAIADYAECIVGQALPFDDRALWSKGLEETDPVASRAVDQFCATLGGALANIALVLGAGSIVLAGGVGQRLAKRVRRTDFAERFLAKEPMQHLLEGIEIRVISHPEPGLFGAAAAYLTEFGK